MTHLTSALSFTQGASRRRFKVEPDVVIAAAVLLGLFAAIVGFVLLVAPPIGPEALLGATT